MACVDGGRVPPEGMARTGRVCRPPAGAHKRVPLQLHSIWRRPSGSHGMHNDGRRVAAHGAQRAVQVVEVLHWQRP